MPQQIKDLADLKAVANAKAWARTGNIGSIISFYESDQFYLNDQLNYCLGGNYIELYQSQRKGLDRVCYHIHIKDRADNYAFKRARHYLGGHANYEIELVGNKWVVMTGEYEIKKVTRSYDRYYSEMYFPVDRQKLKVLKEFNFDEYALARKYCIQAADPYKGKICWWRPKNNIIPGYTFVGAIDYQIVENDDQPARPFQALRITDAKVIEKDELNLNKALGEHATLAAAQAACQKDYEEFFAAYANNESLGNKTSRPWRGKIRRPEFRGQFADVEEICRWEEIPHATGKYYYLYHASNEKLNYLINFAPEKSQVIKITTLVNNYYRYSANIRTPEVEELTVEGDLATVQAFCIEDLKKEHEKIWFLDWRRFFSKPLIN